MSGTPENAQDIDAAIGAVVSLPRPAERGPVTSVIAMLEETLAEARDGDVIAVAIAYVRPGGVVGQGFAGPPRPIPFHNELAGALLDLQHALAVERAKAYQQPAPASAGES